MSGARALSILIYHRVLAGPDPLLPDVPDVAAFDRQMRLLRRFFRVMPLATALRQLRQGTLPARALCITFDDGYADNAELALPVLQRHGLHATFFIATAYLNGGRMWNDEVIDYVRQAPAGRLDFSMVGCGSLPGYTHAQRRAAIDRVLTQLKYLPFSERRQLAGGLVPWRRRPLMMNSAQIHRLLAAGMELGAHTHHHPILAAMPDADAYADIAEGKAALEAVTGKPATLFAYPNGKPGADYDQRHVDMVRSLGFEAALSTVAGTAGPGSDPWQLPRYTPWERDGARFLARLLQSRYREHVRRRVSLPPALGG